MSILNSNQDEEVGDVYDLVNSMSKADFNQLIDDLERTNLFLINLINEDSEAYQLLLKKRIEGRSGLYKKIEKLL